MAISYIFKQFFVSLSSSSSSTKRMFFCLSLSLFLCVRVYEACKVPSSYRQLRGRGQLLSRRYCKHSVWLFLCAFRRRRRRPKALWRFRVSTSNSPSGLSGCTRTRTFVIFIILTLDKIFKYVEMTIYSRPIGSYQSQGALLLRVSI